MAAFYHDTKDINDPRQAPVIKTTGVLKTPSS
jgi:hypothetical protein